MSQTITYKTKYKNLSAIKKTLDNLAKKGVFGENAVVSVTNDKNKNFSDADPNFRRGLFNPPAGEDVIFIVRDPGGRGNSKVFGNGFYETGIAISQNRETKEISIVYDYNSGQDEKVTASTRKMLEAKIEAGATLETDSKALSQVLKNMKISNPNDTSYVIEGEITEEQLKNLIATMPK